MVIFALFMTFARRGLLGAGLGLALPAGVGAQSDLPRKVRKTVGAYAFSLSLSTDFDQMEESEGPGGSRIWTFLTKPRPDGGQGTVQVSVFDLEQVAKASGDPGATKLDTDQLLTTLLKGMASRRRGWKQSQPRVESLAGVAAKRVEWSGAMAGPQGDRPARGIMFAGRVGPMAFAVHAEDIEPFAAKTLPLWERALRSFTIAKSK